MPVAMLVDNPEGSAEIYDKVRRQLGEAFEAVGVPGPPAPPQFWPVHNYAK